MKLKINDASRREHSVIRLGHDGNPLLVVDNFLENPHEVREFGLDLQFRAPKTRYPGYRAECSMRGVPNVSQWVGEHVWTEVYDHPPDHPLIADFDGSTVQSDTSFNCFCPRLDANIQSIHIDSHSWLAILIYLKEDMEDQTGTAFWRHTPTGLESMFYSSNLLAMQTLENLFEIDILEKLRATYADTPRLQFETVVREMMKEGPPPPPDQSHGDWELLDSVQAKFNRLVAYPTWQWHSAVYPHYTPPETLDDARLTLNTFVEYPLERLQSDHVGIDLDTPNVG
ncbi:MAG: DUF6445 family protein [Bradymonadaceae bacterium]